KPAKRVLRHRSCHGAQTRLGVRFQYGETERPALAEPPREEFARHPCRPRRDIRIRPGQDVTADQRLQLRRQAWTDSGHSFNRVWAVSAGRAGPMYSKPAVRRVLACFMTSPCPASEGRRVILHNRE